MKVSRIRTCKISIHKTDINVQSIYILYMRKIDINNSKKDISFYTGEYESKLQENLLRSLRNSGKPPKKSCYIFDR